MARYLKIVVAFSVETYTLFLPAGDGASTVCTQYKSEWHTHHTAGEGHDIHLPQARQV